MKQFIFIVMMLLSTANMNADPITKDVARKTAQTFMAKHGQKKTEGLMLAYQGARPLAAKGRGVAAKNAYYYIYNNTEEGGFVIISGDDATEEILGYSESGTFDVNDIPENMQELLDYYQEEIAFARANNLRRAKAATTDEVDNVARQVIPPLVPSTWGQDAPYNQLCFTTTDKQAVTGCVATAMAQIMYSHKWPQEATQEIPAYSTYDALPAIAFDWQHMTDTYGSGNSDAENLAVAQLMEYCGHAVSMSYGTGSSGASTADAATAFKTYFGYGSSVCSINRNCFNTEEWDEIAYNELYNGRPIIYSGNSRAGGHAFICDGYDGYGLFHINWGWDGSWNGYYRLQSLFPQYSGSFSRMLNTGGYNRSQSMVLGITPTDEIVSPFTDIVPVTRARIEGFSFSGSNEIDYVKGSSSFYNIKLKMNITAGSPDPFSYGIGLYKDGEKIQSMTVYSAYSITDGYTYTITFNIWGMGSNLDDGTYQIKSISKLASSDTWQESVNADNAFVEVVIADGKATFTAYDNATGIGITDVSRVHHSSTNFLRTTFVNTSECDYQGNVYLYINGSYKVVERLFVSAGKEDFVDLELNNNTTTDTVTVKIYENNGYTTLYEETIDNIPTVTGTPTTNQLTLVSSEMRCVDTNAKKVYGNTIEGTLTLKNESELDFAGSITFTLNYLKSKNENGSVSYSWRTENTPLEVKAGETKEVIVRNSQASIGEEVWYSLSVGGNTISDGGAFNRFTVVDGYSYWNGKGECDAKELTTDITIPDDATAISFGNASVSNIVPNDNPNTLYIFHADATVPSSLDGKNVVTGYKATNLSLSDGYNYYIPKAITVEGTVSYTRIPTKGSNGRKGWRTIVLPFAVQKVTNATDGEEVDWQHPSGNGTGNLWVKEFAGVKDGQVIFKNVETWVPNEPYIMAVGDGDNGLVGKQMVLSATNAKVMPTATSEKVTAEYSYVGTSLDKELPTAYLINEEGDAFVLTQDAAVKASHAYFTAAIAQGDQLTSIPIRVGLLGDVNGDGLVNITDVVLLVDYVLGINDPSFIKANADINADDSINILDATLLVNIIMEKG